MRMVVFTAALALLAAPPASAAAIRVSGASPFAACDAPAFGGISYLDSEAEPSVAIDPRDARRIIGVFQQDPWSNRGAHALVAGVSGDSGASWTQSWPAFSICQGGAFVRASDPWVSIGPDGTAYFASLSTLAAIQVSASADGGLTWHDPATVIAEADRLHANDKPTVSADPYRPGRAYLVWTRDAFPSDIANPAAFANARAAVRAHPYFSSTDDGGATWSPARDIAPQFKDIFTLGNQIAVEPDGTLIDVFNYGKGSGADTPNLSTIAVQRSRDGGATWSPQIDVADDEATEDADPDTGAPLATGGGFGNPDIAVDPRSGTLYVVWEDARFSAGDHNDIAISSSSDDGRTWTAPTKVNQTPVPVMAFTPSVDVLPDGTIAVSYYDIRHNTPDPALATDSFLASSRDGGTAWTETRLTPASFDDTLAPIRQGEGYFLGDYQGLANDGSAFVALFAQTDATTRTTDIWSARVTP